MTAFFIESIWVGFDVILKAFATPFKKWTVKILPIIFKRVAKTCNVTVKPKQLLSLSSNMSYPANTYGLKIGRKNKHQFDKNWDFIFETEGH